MKLEQFEQVMEVEKCGTFSQAARNLYMSQPNLSLSIKQLEEELDCQIFVRTSEGVVPTPEGKDLIEHMAIIHNQYKALKDYKQVKVNNRLSLRIGMTNMNRAVPSLIDITKKYADSPVSFQFMTYTMISTIIDRVLTGQLDFALIGMMDPYVKNTLNKLENSHIEYHRLSRHPVYAVVGPENEFYERQQPISIEDIRSQTMVSFGTAVEDPYSAILETSNITLEPRGMVSVNNGYLFYEMVQCSSVMGLVTCNREVFPQRKRWPQLRLLEICDYPIISEAGWIKLHRTPLSDISVELLDELAKIF